MRTNYLKNSPMQWAKPLAKIALALCLISFQISFSQINNYSFSQGLGTYEPLTGATIIATATGTSGAALLDDERYENIAIPFSFSFGSQSYTALSISSNGYISFGTSLSATNSSPISSGTTGGAIAPLAADLSGMSDFNGKTSTIETKTIGSAPNQTFVIEWKHFKYYSNTLTNHFDYNFQVRLNQNGTINFAYNFNVVGSPSTMTAQVGLRGSTTTDFVNRSGISNASNNWNTTTTGTSSSATIPSSAALLPTSGLTFNWTPPAACIAPTAQPTDLNLTNTGIIIHGTFTAASPAADRYLILRTLSGTTPNAPVNGTVYTLGQNATLNAYVSYYGANTSFEENYNNGAIRGNNHYVYTIYSVSSACTGGPIYLNANPLSNDIINCPLSVNGITAGSATSNSFQLNWPASENGTAQAYDTIIEVATNSTFTSMIAGSPFTLNSTDLSLSLSGLSPNTQYFFRGKNVSTCDSGYSTAGNIYTSCVAVASFYENFDAGTTTAVPNCWSKILTSATGSTPTINVSSTDAASQPRNVSFYGDGANTDLATTKIILVSPEINNLAAGTHRLRFKARKTSTTTSPSATSLQVVALDGNTATANSTVVQAIAALTTTYQEYTVDFTNFTGSGNYIGIQRIGGPTYSYMYVDDVIWEQVPSCTELNTLVASNPTPTGATLTWTDFTAAPANGYEYFVSTTNAFPAETETFIPSSTTSVVLNNLGSSLTPYYFFVRRICGTNDKSSWKTVSFSLIPTTPAPWLEAFATTAVPTAWTTTGWTLGAVRGATGNTGTNIYKNIFGTTPSGSFSTIAVGPINAADYELSFDYKQSNYDSPYASLAAWGNFQVMVSTDFGVNWASIATVTDEAGTGSYIHKTYPLTAYQNQYVQIKIIGNRTAGDFDLSFDNFEIKRNIIIPVCNGANPGENVGDTSCITLAYSGQNVTYATVRAADGNIWLQQNLGSDNVATEMADAPSYGDLFQWGRWDDGHQKRNSATAAAPNTNSPSGLTGGQFITGSPAWWSSNSLTDKWQAETPSNVTDSNGCDPCKALGEGWKLPSQDDWTTLIARENITNPATAYASTLKLPANGYRSATNGDFTFVGTRGYYWSSTSTGIGGKYLYIGTTLANPASGSSRGQGAAIRCLKYGQDLGTDTPVANNLSIYPNPTTGFVKIQADLEIESIKVYNMLGQLVLSQKSTTIDLSDSAKGMYIFQVDFENGQQATQKIIKR